MPTRNQIAHKVANALQQPFNQELIERIKDSSKWLITTFIRQSIEKRGLESTLLQSYIVPLILSNYPTYCSSLALDCPVLISINLIELPIRMANDSPFTFVGTVSRRPFRLFNPSANRHNRFMNFPIDEIYNYINGRIIIPNNNLIKNIIVESIFENPEALIENCTCNGDDSELPISGDILALVDVELMKQFASIKIEDKTVNTE